MKNQKVAHILNRIADYLEMDGIDFRTKAYRRAAHTIEFLPQPIEDLRKKGRLTDLSGVGKSIALKIEEILDTGTLKYLDDLKEEYNLDFDSLASVEGLGPKTIKRLYLELGVRNLDDLEKEAKRHHIRRLKGLGSKTEQKILHNLAIARQDQGRRRLGDVFPMAQELQRRIESLPEVEKAELAGSIRRRKETVGDIDVLTLTHDPEAVMDYFVNLEMVEDIIAHGPSKSTVRLENGLDVDLRVFREEDYGSALVYFTGSRELNVELRKIAISKGLKLNEYGVFRGEEQLAGATEEEVFQSLDLDYIPPELRENRGEVEAAQNGMLPDLIDHGDIRGDLHLHTEWSDGETSVKDMALEALNKGYEYMAITDHTKGLSVVGGLDEEQLKVQMREIDEINEQLDGIEILKGAELNIGRNGELDIKDDVLEELDIVLATIHSGSNIINPTSAVLKVVENEHVDVLAHPTGRKIRERRAYDLDLDQIFQAAKDNGTILEVDSQPKRLDLNDVNIKRALDYDCKIMVNTDAHHPQQLEYINLGVATARRGWAEKKDVINTLDLNKFRKYLK